jgi:hypothetical protein
MILGSEVTNVNSKQFKFTLSELNECQGGCHALNEHCRLLYVTAQWARGGVLLITGILVRDH